MKSNEGYRQRSERGGLPECLLQTVYLTALIWTRAVRYVKFSSFARFCPSLGPGRPRLVQCGAWYMRVALARNNVTDLPSGTDKSVCVVVGWITGAVKCNGSGVEMKSRVGKSELSTRRMREELSRAMAMPRPTGQDRRSFRKYRDFPKETNISIVNRVAQGQLHLL